MTVDSEVEHLISKNFLIAELSLLLRLLLFYSPLGLDLSTVPGSSTLAVDSTSLLLASVDSAVSADTHSIVVKRSAEHEEALSGGNVSPACKVLKLADSIPMAAADRVKPGMYVYFVIPETPHVSFIWPEK